MTAKRTSMRRFCLPLTLCISCADAFSVARTAAVRRRPALSTTSHNTEAFPTRYRNIQLNIPHAVQTDREEITSIAANSEQTKILDRPLLTIDEEDIKADQTSLPTFESDYALLSTLDVFDGGEKQNTLAEKKETGNISEIAGLALWMGALSTFLLVNNFLGPWPQNILDIPVKTWGLTHGVAGMLFGGGIIITTCIEWLVANSKNSDVWNFWFSKVPALDALIVLPALTASIVSGTALAVDHYESLAQAPFHVTAALSTLLAFAGWWGITDVTTQSKATQAVQEFTASSSSETEIPGVIQFRKFSNVVSCAFVAALYAIMITKPGFNA